MDEAGATRQAALGAVRDVEPAGLHERIAEWLEQGSMVPGVLTIRFARATDCLSATTDGELADPVSERAAGVQLIYDGLRLTRRLAHDEPWATGDDAADLDILVADVLVARGFYLLAKTDASERAVETVRAFGRDQTRRQESDGDSLDRDLETDALELAAAAGTAFGDHTLSPGAAGFAAELVEDLDGTADFPPAAEFLAGVDTDRLRGLTAEHGSDGLTTSVDD